MAEAQPAAPLSTSLQHDAPLLEYRAILEHAGMAILFTRDRRIYRCNRRAAELFGWPDEAAMVGESARVLFASEDEFAELSRRARPTLALGGIFTVEFDLARRNGNRFNAHVVASAIDAANPRNGAIWIIDDITAQKRLEFEKERLLREHECIFEQALVGIMFARNRVIERCNRRMEDMFGRAPGSLAETSTRALFASDELWEEAGHRVYSAIRESGHFRGEIELVRADGSPLWCRVHGTLADPEDPEVGTVWIYEDVTERRRAELDLLASHRELEERVVQRTTELRSQVHFLHQLIDAIPSPVFYKGADLRYIGCNRAFEELVGRREDDLLGLPGGDVLPSSIAASDDESDKKLLACPGSEIHETRLLLPDGSRRDLLVHKAVYTRPDGAIDGIVGIMVDTTERREMAERIELASTVFDSTADGVTIAGPDGRIIAVNRAFTEITGYTEDEARGQNPRILQSGRQDAAYYERLWNTLLSEGRWSGEIWNRRKNGTIFPEHLTITAVRDSSGAVRHYVAVFSDITQVKTTQEALDYQAHHDALTGLPNRLLLEDRLDTALQRALRVQHSVALLFIDLDRFKIINDTLGHHVGDLVLCEAANRFSQIVRQSDTVARLGGDEFVIIVEQATDSRAVARIADKILDDLKKPIVAQGQEFFIGASIGVALYPQDGEDGATLLKHADAAMYRAKDRGRNTFEFFKSDLSASSVERFRMEADIRYAIERSELIVYFQPQFSLRDDRMTGAEALVRWRHPERGMIPPGQFIPIAEDSGLIVPMGEWILRQACAAWARWHLAGLHPGVLAVNVSGIEFRRGRIRESVEMTLAATQLPPELLELEITESSIMNQAEAGIQALDELRALGLQIAIDDFGTGYSSLAYLKRLPINKIKVDQSFVHGLPGDTDDVAIAGAVIALARSLQLRTIAEGVETAAQKEFLSNAGCEEVQGYLLGRPMPPEEFESLLLSRGRERTT